jgi:hypothetical protein
MQGRGEIDSTVKKHAKDPVMAKWEKYHKESVQENDWGKARNLLRKEWSGIWDCDKGLWWHKLALYLDSSNSSVLAVITIFLHLSEVPFENFSLA